MVGWRQTVENGHIEVKNWYEKYSEKFGGDRKTENRTLRVPSKG